MKKIKYILIIALLFNIGACTDGFEELNQNPNQITDESLEQDFQIVGSKYAPMFRNIFGNQVDHNLSNESWAQHLAQPTVFVGNANNTTYDITWNGYWNRVYGQIMSPSGLVIKLATEAELPMFVEWARLIRILGISRLTAYHGPVIFTDFGAEGAAYDSEPALYNAMFSQLDEIQALFAANVDAADLAEFDPHYGGDIPSWIKLINSLRLRLAMRISMADPTLAKTQGEKALNDAGGLITSVGENFNIDLYGSGYHPVTISFAWNDTRMSATMESVLIGYEDSRIAKFFDPVADLALVPDHPNYPYKGIRNGASLDAKDDHIPYSTISSDFKSVTNRRYMGAAEVEFIKAEAVLRGWSSPNLTSAQAHYEAGVNASFEEWGAGGAAAYLADDTKLPINYDDIVYSGDRNDFVNMMMVTVKWDEGASNEVKLERIITQKWIAARTNTMEAWVDHRRTGYPKLPPVFVNASSSEDGIVPDGEFLKRVIFTGGQRNNNAASVAAAVATMNGPDEINTRLWWDTGANF